jgi:hypothetical protein
MATKINANYNTKLAPAFEKMSSYYQLMLYRSNQFLVGQITQLIGMAP